MSKILMVCMGNICRSPMAQVVATAYVKKAGIAHQFTFDSAGTHALPVGSRADSRARMVLEKRSYIVGKSRSRQIHEKDFQRFDWILAMDRSNLLDLQRQCPPEHAHKVRLLLDGAENTDSDEIPDPYYGNLAGFERVLDLCEVGVHSFMKRFG